MKRLSITLIAIMMSMASLWARPGYNKPLDVRQPDGTTVTLLMHGDEFLSFMTTTDGYTVVKGDDGYYRYAEKRNGGLTATAYVAKNPEQRQPAEWAFLTGKKRMLHADMTEEGKKWKAMAEGLYSATYSQYDGVRRAITPGTISSRINYNNFKGLVVLVNWNDRQFSVDNPQEFYQKLSSEKNYIDDTKTHYPVATMGSTRDYFFANSMGIFDPTFDVIGPVTINYSCEYPTPKTADGKDSSGFSDRMVNILKASMNQINSLVDFNDYDLNNDGVIDMVYFIFAGYGSYVTGNSHKYIWPHANDFTSYSTYIGMTNYDGKKFGRYACGVEIQDQEEAAEEHVYLDGIGTMCHEFSHVLGLADHYDTNYDEGGQAPTAGAYDVMDGGADHNYGMSPAGYNAFERYILGFADETVKPLDVEGNYQLEAFDTSAQGYIVKSAKNGEVFYIENRQKQGWDTYLPDHGLLVWRADTSRPSRWTNNTVNTTPSSMCFELLGNAPITSYDLTASTNSVWSAKGAAMDLYTIKEADGIVTFEAGKDLYPSIVEDFEATPLTDGDATGLAGKFCTWDLKDAIITATTDDLGSDAHMAQINRNGTITSSVLANGLRTMKLNIQNGSQKVRFLVKVSTDGTNWTQLGNTQEIAKNKDAELDFYDIPAGSRIQFSMLGTSNSAVCYLDNIQVTMPKNSTAVSTVKSETGSDKGYTYNLNGQRVADDHKGLVIKNGKKVWNK